MLKARILKQEVEFYKWEVKGDGSFGRLMFLAPKGVFSTCGNGCYILEYEKDPTKEILSIATPCSPLTELSDTTVENMKLKEILATAIKDNSFMLKEKTIAKDTTENKKNEFNELMERFMREAKS